MIRPVLVHDPHRHHRHRRRCDRLLTPAEKRKLMELLNAPQETTAV